MATIFARLGIPFSLGPLLLVLGVLVISTAGLKYFRTILTQKTRVGFITWMRSKNMENFLHSDLSYFHQERLGVMTGTLTTQSYRAGYTVVQFVDVISSLAVIAAYLTAALIIAPVLMVFVLGTLLLVSLGVQYFMAKVRRIATEGVHRENELQGAAIETLSGIHVVKSFLLERLRWRDFETKAENAGEITYRIAKNQSLITTFQEIGLFALAGSIVYLGVSVLDVGITVVIALLFILYRMMPKVMGFNVSRQALIASLAAMHSVKETMDETSNPTIVGGDRPFSKLTTDIQFKNVDFSYNGSGPVLANADFTIESRKMTAIAGASGAGKTTLIDLILRLYDPGHGSILVDGVDLKELDLDSWRKSIGVVSQDVFLFNVAF